MNRYQTCTYAMHGLDLFFYYYSTISRASFPRWKIILFPNIELCRIFVRGFETLWRIYHHANLNISTCMIWFYLNIFYCSKTKGQMFFKLRTPSPIQSLMRISFLTLQFIYRINGQTNWYMTFLIKQNQIQ